MIVRVLNEGQFDVPDAEYERLSELDRVVDAALGSGDAQGFEKALDELIAAVRAAGTPVANDVILPSDLVLPPEGASLSEVAALLASEDVDS